MKTPRPPMVYPFVTRRQVLDRLDRDSDFARECLAILHRRYAERAVLPPPAGWMSSHRKLGEQTYARLVAPDVTAADIAAAAKLAKRYAKQLTKCFRDEQLAREPGLGLAAAVFGVRGADDGIGPLDDGEDPYAEDDSRSGVDEEPPAAHSIAATATPIFAPVDAPSDCAPPMVNDVPPVRRRGRPPGSKNKKSVTNRAKPVKRGRHA